MLTTDNRRPRSIADSAQILLPYASILHAMAHRTLYSALNLLSHQVMPLAPTLGTSTKSARVTPATIKQWLNAPMHYIVMTLKCKLLKILKKFLGLCLSLPLFLITLNTITQCSRKFQLLLSTTFIRISDSIKTLLPAEHHPVCLHSFRRTYAHSILWDVLRHRLRLRRLARSENGVTFFTVADAMLFGRVAIDILCITYLFAAYSAWQP